MLLSLLNGLLDIPWWGYVLYTLALTHITIIAVTIYLHRHQAHRAINMHPALAHFFRFWLWLTTGMVTSEWVAIHRKHHARVETEEDPHSPLFAGIKKVLFSGAELYRDEAKNADTMKTYGHETPNDWLENKLYSSFSSLGIILLLILNFTLFGVIGIAIWAVQMMWIPFFAAGVINGLGHWCGYRNFSSDDSSTNIVPWGILIGGEELHNNHHAFASSAKFSNKPWEFDIGWLYIRLLEKFGLVTVKKVAPKPVKVPEKKEVDESTVGAVVLNRLHVLAEYTHQVIQKVSIQEAEKTKIGSHTHKKDLKKLSHTTAERLLDASSKDRFEQILMRHENLRIVFEFRTRLQQLWNEKTATTASLVTALQEWCNQAEQSGIEALVEFANRLRSYSLTSAAAI